MFLLVVGFRCIGGWVRRFRCGFRCGFGGFGGFSGGCLSSYVFGDIFCRRRFCCLGSRPLCTGSTTEQYIGRRFSCSQASGSTYTIVRHGCLDGGRGSVIQCVEKRGKRWSKSQDTKKRRPCLFGPHHFLLCVCQQNKILVSVESKHKHSPPSRCRNHPRPQSPRS